MKKFKIFYVALMSFLLIGAVNVKASEVEVSDADALISCVGTDENVCVLASDILLDGRLDIEKNVTIDLNGHSIMPDSTLENGSTALAGGLLTIIHGSTLIIDDSVGTGKISAGTSGKVYAAVQLTKKEKNDISKVAALIVENGTLEGYWYAVTGNGNPDRINTSITINGGTLKATAAESLGIFHPQDGVITINGGTITGGTGIEMRAGKLVVNGGTITGTNKPSTTNSNGSGSTTDGVGIAIAQHTTLKNISVVVNGGTIEGHTAVYESNPESNSEEDIKKTSIVLNDGKFNATLGGTNAVYSQNKRLTINGGIYNSDVTQYKAANVIVSEIEEGIFHVGHQVLVEYDEKMGTLGIDKVIAATGQKITITVEPKEGYFLKKLSVVDTNGYDVAIDNLTFTMPDSDVTVAAVFEEIPKYNIIIADYDEEMGLVKVENTKLVAGEDVEIAIQANEGYIIESLKVVDANGAEITVTDQHFTMPDSDVTITGTFSKIEYEQDVESTPVDTTAKVEEITVGVTGDGYEETLKEALQASDLDIENKNVVVVVDIANKKVEDLTVDTTTKMTETLTKAYAGAKIAGYFDITLNVLDKENNDSLGTLTELKKAIELSVVLPEELQKVEEGYTRSYYIIREHEGQIHIIRDVKVSQDGNSISFETDEFSTYALAYEDTQIVNEEVPETLDGIGSSLTIGLISLVSAASICLYFKKKYN